MRPQSDMASNRDNGGTDSGSRELIAASLRGDLQAYRGLYDLHVGSINALALRMTADPARAEALTQDIFVRAWGKLSTYRGTAPFGAWLRRLAVNVIIEDGRRGARIREREQGGVELDELNPEVTGGVRIGGRIDSGSVGEGIDLERAIRALPQGARQAFVLHDLAGFTHREIGEMSDLKEGTVKAQLHRARNLLRQSLREREGGRP